MSMNPKLVAFAYFVPANPVATFKTYNCTIARNAAGDYTLTVGEGGADATQCMVNAVAATAAAGGATSARCPSVIQTSDTAKRIQTRDDAGTLAEAAAMWVTVERLPAF